MTGTEKLDLILQKLESHDKKLDSIDKKLESHDQKLDTIETDLKDIKLTLENEIRVNIKRIAEGHMDLSRNLHDAMKPSNEVEMLALKVRMLETEVRELERRIS